MRKSRQLLSESLLYTLGDVANKGAKLLLLPVYVNLLSVSEYALLERTLISLALAHVLIGFGSKQFLLRHLSQEPKQQRALLARALRISGSISLGLTAIMLVIARMSFPIIEDFRFGDFWYLIPSYSFIVSGYEQLLIYLRFKSYISKYLIISLTSSIGELGLIYLLISLFKFGADSKYIGGSIAYLMVLIPYFIFILRMPQGWQFDNKRDYWTFSGPVVAHLFAGFVLANTSKIILNGHLGGTEFAVFAFGLQVATVFKFSSDGSLKAFNIWWYRNIESLRTHFGMLFQVGTLGIISYACVFSIATPWFVDLISPENFGESSSIAVQYIFVKSIAMGSYLSLVFLYGQKDSKSALYSSMSGALICVSVGWLLIPKYQIAGAIVTDLSASVSVTLLLLGRVRQTLKGFGKTISFLESTSYLIYIGLFLFLYPVFNSWYLLTFIFFTSTLHAIFLLNKIRNMLARTLDKSN